MRILHALLMLVALCAKRASAQTSVFHVYFATGSTVLDPVSRAYLDRIVHRDLLHDGATWDISGYADKPGSAAANDSLSFRRARGVADYLLKEGFLNPGSIISISGSGSSAAVSEGDDKRFRRVDIRPHENLPKPAGNAFSERVAALKHNETLALPNLNFYGGSPAFLPSADSSLKELLQFMRSHPAVRVRLEGHICCPGPKLRPLGGTRYEQIGYNYAPEGETLSVERARAVYNYLKSNGIGAERMEFKGFGHTRMKIDPERTAEDSETNRRVEVRVLKR